MHLRNCVPRQHLRVRKAALVHLHDREVGQIQGGTDPEAGRIAADIVGKSVFGAQHPISALLVRQCQRVGHGDRAVEGAALHVQGLKDQLLHQLFVVFAGDDLGHVPGQDKHGIAVQMHLARLCDERVACQFIIHKASQCIGVAWAEILAGRRQAGCVAEHVAQGDPVAQVRITEGEARQVGHHGQVQLKESLVDQAHDQRGGQRFRDRTDTEQRLRSNRQTAVFDTGNAKAARIGDRTAVHDRERQTDRFVRSNKLVYLLLQPVDIEHQWLPQPNVPAACEYPGCARRDVGFKRRVGSDRQSEAQGGQGEASAARSRRASSGQPSADLLQPAAHQTYHEHAIRRSFRPTSVFGPVRDEMMIATFAALRRSSAFRVGWLLDGVHIGGLKR